MKKTSLILIGLLLTACVQLSGQTITFYEQNFEGAWPADGIANPAFGDPGGYYWQMGNAATWSSTNFTIPDHSNFLVVNDDGYDAGNDYSYATPKPNIDMPDEDGLKLTFDIFFLGETYAGLYELAELYLYDYTTFTAIALPFSGSTSWQSLEYDMSPYRGHNLYFSITYFDQYEWMYGVAVDNIKFTYENPLPPVTVTYQVDVTNYLEAGNSIAGNGIRIAGNFQDFAATAGGDPMVSWAPLDAASECNYLGSNIWSIQVTYPGEYAGLTQYYKFVNGDWGTNEGTDPENTLGADGCGVDDGAGNVNRTLVIPSSNGTYKYCWDNCTPNCPEIVSIDDQNQNAQISIYPNPSETYISIKYLMSSSENVNIEITDVSGRTIYSINQLNANTGENYYNMDVRNMESGVYYININSGKSNYTGTFVVL